MAGQPLSAAQLEELKAGLGVSAPVTQNSIDSLNKGAPWGAPVSPVENMLGTPNLAMNTPVPMPEKESPTPGSKEVTHITKPDGEEIKKIKTTIAEPKVPKANMANGDFVPGGALPGKTMANAENTQSKTVGTTASRLVDLPPDVLAAYDALRQQREAQILDAEAAAGDFATSYEPRTDMSALLSFFGSQTGRDYMSGYKKPGGLNELVGMQDKLEENIAKAKTGLSDTELQYLKARMGLQETTKTSTTDSNKDMNAELLAKKLLAGGDGLGAAKFEGQTKRDETDKMTEFLTKKEFGKTLDAHDKMFQASSNVNKILYNRDGKAPAPGTTEARKFSQAVAELIYLVNSFDAELGALAAADVEYLEGALGFKNKNKAIEFLESNYNEGLIEAVRVFQDRLEQQNDKKVADINEAYQFYPNVIKIADRKAKENLKSREDMNLSRVGKGKGQTQSKKSAEDEEAEKMYQSLSPEDRARVDNELKGGGLK